MNTLPGDDEEMNAAIEEAQRQLPEFRRALEDDARRLIPVLDSPLVKARFYCPAAHTVEHIWIDNITFEADNIIGTLANDPFDIAGLQKGSRVTVSPADVTDWIYRDCDQTYGGFTVQLMQQRGLEP